MMVCSPLFVYYVLACGTTGDWGLALPSQWTVKDLIALLPKWNWAATPVYLGWLLMQAVLYFVLPGAIGTPTRREWGRPGRGRRIFQNKNSRRVFS